jgi:hypothetical protein
MAGFKQPYEILSFNLQSFSVYDRNYELKPSTIALLLMMQPMITTINY